MTTLRAYALSGLLVALIPLSALAFSPGPAQMDIGAVETFFVADDLDTSITWNAVTPNDAQNVLAANRAAQYWNISARINTALVVDVSTVTITSPPIHKGNANSRNEIFARARDMLEPLEINSNAYTWCIVHPNPPFGSGDRECDIVLMTNSSESRFTLPNSAGQIVAANDFERTVNHEMGHALGLLHTAPGICDNTSTGDPSVEGPLMCTLSQLGQTASPNHVDHAAQDDIDGVRASQSGYSTISRQIGLMKGTVVDSAGHITWDEDFSGAVFSSVVRPRIACRTGNAAPDCVAATTTTSNSVMLTALTWNNPWQITSSTPMSNASFHEVDIA